jgi:hypothetical protein
MREAGYPGLRRLIFCLSGISACSLTGSPASALDSVRVIVDECEDFDRDSVQRLLRIEMADRLSRESLETVVDVAVLCRPAAVVIRVTNSKSTSIERTLAPGEARGQVGARVVALKAVELLREWDERGVVAAPVPVPEIPEEPADSDFRVLLAGELLSVGLQSPFWGAELSFEYMGYRPFFGRFSLGFLTSRRNYEEGDASGRILMGRADLGLRDQRGWFAWGGGLGYRLGEALLQGEAAAPEQAVGEVRGLWGGPLGEFFVEVQGEEHFVAQFSVEGGIPLHRVSGTISGHADLALDQPWLGLSLAVGAHW